MASLLSFIKSALPGWKTILLFFPFFIHRNRRQSGGMAEDEEGHAGGLYPKDLPFLHNLYGWDCASNRKIFGGGAVRSRGVCMHCVCRISGLRLSFL